MVQSRLDRANMAVVNAVYPGLGLGGRATGSIDFAQANADAFPRADARLTLSAFTLPWRVSKILTALSGRHRSGNRRR